MKAIDRYRMQPRYRWLNRVHRLNRNFLLKVYSDPYHHHSRTIRLPADARAPFLICAVLGAVLLGITLIVGSLAPESLSAFVTVMLIIDLAVIIPSLVSYFLRFRHAAEAERQAELQCAEVGNLFRDTVGVGYAVVDENGVVMVVNRWLQNILGYRTPLCRVLLTDLCDHGGLRHCPPAPMPREKTRNRSTPRQAPLRVAVRAYPMRLRQSVLSGGLHRRDRIPEPDRPYRGGTPRRCLRHPRLARRAWRSTSGSVTATRRMKSNRSSRRGRGTARTDPRIRPGQVPHSFHESLDKCISSKFDILERIRAVRLGDNSFPVTVSMGICAKKLTFLKWNTRRGVRWTLRCREAATRLHSRPTTDTSSSADASKPCRAVRPPFRRGSPRSGWRKWFQGGERARHGTSQPRL